MSKRQKSMAALKQAAAKAEFERTTTSTTLRAANIAPAALMKDLTNAEKKKATSSDACESIDSHLDSPCPTWFLEDPTFDADYQTFSADLLAHSKDGELANKTGITIHQNKISLLVSTSEQDKEQEPLKSGELQHSVSLSDKPPSIHESINPPSEDTSFLSDSHIHKTPRTNTGSKGKVKRNLFSDSDVLDPDLLVLSLSDSEEIINVNGTFDNLPVGVHIDIPVIDNSGSLSPLVPIEFEDSLFGNDVLPTDNQHNLEGDGEPSKKRRYTPPEKSTRKRLAVPSNWIRNQAKLKLAKGEEHITMKGVLRRGREMQEGCNEGCRNQCQDKVTKEQRQEIFKSFWNTNNQEEKWNFIARHLKIHKVADKPGGAKKRKTFRHFFFTIDGELVKVCKTMFLDTLDVCDSLVETTVAKLGLDGFISPDKRRNHVKERPTDPVKVSIMAHIQIVPRLPSHYSRQRSSKDFVAADFQSVSDLHHHYLAWMEENHSTEKCASLRQYNDVFNTKFNIDFFLPKKDQCEDCTGWENTPEELRSEAIQLKHDWHLKNRQLVDAMQRADKEVARKKESETLVVAHFDFEKTLICPKGNTSVFYYKRKLSVNNFTIVDVGRFEDTCYVYDETVARKGSNDVASFLLHFIQKKVSTGKKEFRFYSDNCTGQNKNRNVTSMYLFASAKYHVSITHKFLEKGHTYNAADTVHSLIERKTKKMTIYSPQQWYTNMKASKRSKAHPMLIEEVNQDMIYNWFELSTKLNLDKDESGNVIPWLSLRQISVSAEKPHQMQYRINFEEELKNVSTKHIGRPVNFQTFNLTPAYSEPLPISKVKHEDLLYYCNRNIIPTEFHDFYKGLPSPSCINVPDTTPEESETTDVAGRARKRKKPAAKQQTKQPKQAAKASARSKRSKKTFNEED